MTDVQNNESHSQVAGVAVKEEVGIHICNKGKDTVVLVSSAIQLQGNSLRAVKAQTGHLKKGRIC